MDKTPALLDGKSMQTIARLGIYLFFAKRFQYRSASILLSIDPTIFSYLRLLKT
jgi:hypothetical protein